MSTSSPTLRDRWSLRTLHLKRWALSKQPWLIWGPRGMFRAYPEPEIALIGLLCERTQTMVDCGASFGMWSYYAKSVAARVVAFEPLPALAEALRKGFGQGFEVHQVALSSEPGMARITMPALQWGYSTIEQNNDLHGKVNEAFGFQTFDVEKRTVDSYDLRDVGFMKVDTEGHEASVLLGARQTLAREKPALIVETEERHNTGSVGEVSRIAAELGYRRFFLQHGQLRDGREFTIEKNQDMANQAEYVRNLIFLHEPHLAKLRAAKKLPFALPPTD